MWHTVRIIFGKSSQHFSRLLQSQRRISAEAEGGCQLNSGSVGVSRVLTVSLIWLIAIWLSHYSHFLGLINFIPFMVNTLYEEKNWFKKQRKRQKQKPPKYGGMSILSCFVVADPRLQSDERGHWDLPWSLQGG